MFDPKANIIVSPSDQTIVNDNAFFRNITDGLQFVENNDAILTMGVSPTRPEPGYGYIQKGVYTGNGDIYKVQAFTEKPDRQFAQMFMDSKEWCWNTGLFLSNTNYLRQCLYGFLPSVIRDEESGEKITTIEEEEAFIREKLPTLSKHIFRSWYS